MRRWYLRKRCAAAVEGFRRPFALARAEADIEAYCARRSDERAALLEYLDTAPTGLLLDVAQLRRRWREVES